MTFLSFYSFINRVNVFHSLRQITNQVDGEKTKVYKGLKHPMAFFVALYHFVYITLTIFQTHVILFTRNCSCPCNFTRPRPYEGIVNCGCCQCQTLHLVYYSVWASRRKEIRLFHLCYTGFISLCFISSVIIKITISNKLLPE